jgi:hypothetical protein
MSVYIVFVMRSNAAHYEGSCSCVNSSSASEAIMEIEERIARVERISVRIVAAGLLIFALAALLFYGAFELVRFVWHLWTSF